MACSAPDASSVMSVAADAGASTPATPRRAPRSAGRQVRASLAAHLCRKPGHETGKVNKARSQPPSGRRTAASLCDQVISPGHRGSTNRLKPTGGVICAIFDDEDDEDPEPERVDAGLLDRRHDHAIVSTPSRCCRRESSRARRTRRASGSAGTGWRPSVAIHSARWRQADVAHRQRQEKTPRRGSARSCRYSRVPPISESRTPPRTASPAARTAAARRPRRPPQPRSRWRCRRRSTRAPGTMGSTTGIRFPRLAQLLGQVIGASRGGTSTWGWASAQAAM